MKTRPHIVTQTREYETAGLYSNANLIAARMRSVKDIKTVLGYSRTLIRIMKIILDLTVRNNCYAARRDVLESPRLRKLVMERLGGAHALLRWRRQNTWNKARLAAIASGEYRPMQMPHIPLTGRRPKPASTRGAAQKRAAGIKRIADKFLMGKPAPANFGPAKFRLPVLQNLRYIHRSRPRMIHRAKPQTRYPSIVLWPHELDGQYVPDFTSRMRRPPGGYAVYSAPAAPASAATPAIFAPP